MMMRHPQKTRAHNWRRTFDRRFVQALLYPGVSRFRLLTPRCSMFEHRVQDDQQFADAGRQRHFLGFSRRRQALTERLDARIEARGHDRCHIEGRPHLCPSTPDCPLPPQRAAIAIERGHADQGGDLIVRQRPQLWQIRQQCGLQDRADAGHAPQQLLLSAPEGTLPNGLGQISVRLVEHSFQPGDVGRQLLVDHRTGTGQAVLLRLEHLNELAAPRHQGHQFLRVSIRLRAGLRPHHVCKVGQHLRIARIRLRQLPDGFRAVPDLARIDEL